MPINLPPLRERGNDIILLAKHFMDSFSKENGNEKKSLSLEAQQKLATYSFPGNMRELKSVMELAVVMSDENIVQPEHISIHTNKSINTMMTSEKTLKEYEIQIIQHFLDKYEKDVLLVAKKLDVGKSTIYRMIQAGELSTK